MSNLAALSLSLVLLLAAFPLISIGTTQDLILVWWLGVVALVAGGAIPPLGRIVTARNVETPPTRAGLAEDDRI